MEVIQQYWQLGIALVFGGYLAWAEFRHVKRKSDTAKVKKDDSSLAKEIAYAGRLENLVKELQNQNEALHKQILALRLREAGPEIPPSEVLKHFIDRDPGLSWVKRRVGPKHYVMLRCSAGYAREFLRASPHFYDEKSDEEIWPADIAAVFQDNDELVYQSQMGVEMSEPVRGGPAGQQGFFRGRKFSVHLQDGVDYIIGIGYFEKTH